MKKFLMSIFTFILMFTFISSVSAKGNVEITNVSISDKTDIMVANIKNYNGLTLNTKELFYEVGDFVTYKITIKNTTGKSLSVAKISDNLNNEYISSEYNYDKKEIKNNEEYSFNITLKYKKEITDNSMTFNMPLNIVIDYTNGSSTGILVNPDTKDNALVYFIIFVLSAISLVLFKTKKNKLLVFVVALGLVPSIAYASSKLTITMNNEIGIYKRLAIMDTGRNVNSALKELAGNDITTNEDVSAIVDNNIKHIVRARELPSNVNKKVISATDSVVPIYAWYDNETIYYYSESDKIYLNKDSSFMFRYLTKVEDIDLISFDTSNVTNMQGMFSYCSSLTSLDVTHFETSNVTIMRSMFYGCESLKNIDVSHFDTSNVTSMHGMFDDCSSLTSLDVTHFDTSNVTTMRSMFNGCSSLTNLDVSNFDTSNVTTMYAMFSTCTELKSIDVSNFNTSKVTDMQGMFAYRYNTRDAIMNLEEIIGLDKFDTSKVTNMFGMFANCSKLTNLDLSSFDTSNVTNMSKMFFINNSLEKIYVSDKFVTTNVTDSTKMFDDVKKLVGGNGTVYDSTKMDKEYARIDKEGTPGYFTAKN